MRPTLFLVSWKPPDSVLRSPLRPRMRPQGQGLHRCQSRTCNTNTRVGITEEAHRQMKAPWAVCSERAGARRLRRPEVASGPDLPKGQIHRALGSLCCSLLKVLSVSRGNMNVPWEQLGWSFVWVAFRVPGQ